MIRSPLLMLALASVAACARSTPDAAASDAATPYRGASGSPLGESTTGTIGPEGGTLASADGRLVLRVPAGAFSQPTVVGIQPITNTNPHAVGSAYRLSPEGITFSSPVSLTFEYTLADVENRGAAGLGIAFQNGDGSWSAPIHRTVDADARRVTVQTKHFSDWSLFEMYRLTPESATVNTNASQQLDVQSCVREESADYENQSVVTALVPTCTRLADAALVSNWSVNGTTGGSPTTGTVTQGGSGATYTAPGAAPANNPVAVSVEIRVPGKAKVLLVSNLRVVPKCPVPVCQYEGTSRHESIQDAGTSGEFRIIGEARVVWTFSHMSGPQEAVYLPGGTVSAQWLHAGCTISLSPSTHTFTPSPYTPSSQSQLRVDFSKNPAIYSGSGSTGWEGTQSWTCGQGPPNLHEEVSAGWFNGSSVAEQNGRVLRGSSSDEHNRNTWEFRAP
ncbi:MAG: hypothetical protein M3418_08935 [Gemmatimonadota bacterium]|nr:hypothetical protein [Gemmatimonadota bacterium]